MTLRKAVVFSDPDPNAIHASPRDVNLDLRAQLLRQAPLHKNMAAHHSAAIASPMEPQMVRSPYRVRSTEAWSLEAVRLRSASSSSSPQIGSLIGGLVAGMAMLLLLLVVVLAIRHRQERPHAGYVMSVVELEPADEAADRSCEERHLASMQINGYENPTYRFFDKQ